MAGNSPIRRLRIAIIGGGIPGATLVNALFDQPHLDIHIFESAPEISERGAAVGLTVNAPSGPDQWSRALNRSKLKLYRWSTAGPESGLVRTMNHWFKLLVQGFFQVNFR